MGGSRKPGAGRSLARRRKALGLTQQRLGQMAGIHEQTIALIETDRRPGTPEQLEAIRAVLKQRLREVNRVCA